MSNSCASTNEYSSVLSSVKSKHKKNIINGPCRCSSNYNSSESSSEFHYRQTQDEQKLDYDKYNFLLQKSSSISGKNLFDHLVSVIKRIIDERPINVTDYFEQFSRSVRKEKQCGLEPIKNPISIKLARSIIELVKPLDRIRSIEEFEDFCESDMTIYPSSDSTNSTKIQRCLPYNENVLQSQFLFALSGLGFHIDEAFQLSLSVQKVQLHPNVENARFWGRIFSLQGSYYVVEALLTRTEIQNRLRAMRARSLDEMKSFITKKHHLRSSNPSSIEFIPGSKWQSFPEVDLKKMQQQPAVLIPQLQFEEIFNGPEEAIGSGLNRKTYFVTASLSDEWQELPIVAPRHIKASKKIKKYLTGNLNANLEPLFPGTENHYLRAIIARITSGTFIAPKDFFRRMTRKERELAGENEEFDEDEFEIDEEDDLDNDALITRNTAYKQLTQEELALLSNWVHVRPNILNEGRILHVNEQLDIKDLEKKAILSLNGKCLVNEDVDGEYDFEDEEILEKELMDVSNLSEIVPKLFSACNEDQNNEGIPSWTSRYSSVYNKINQMVIMRSNLWPGAFSVVLENFCDCIYLGWGFKFVARCNSFQELSVIRDMNYKDKAVELNDPTIEMEEKWQNYHMKKDIILNDDEEMSDMSVEVDFDDNDN